MNGRSACIFDLDGTLLNTLDDIADSANRVLAAYGYPVHPADAYRAMIGSGVRRLIARAAGCAPDSPETGRLLAAFSEEYTTHAAVKTRPYAGVVPLLDTLAQRGLPLAILSNKTEELTQTLVRRYFPGIRFVRVSGQKEGVPEKPDPTAALRIAAAFGLHPECVTLVGDSDVDMKTAVNAGMRPVGVTWGFRTPGQLKENGAVLLFDQAAPIAAIWEEVRIR